MCMCVHAIAYDSIRLIELIEMMYLRVLSTLLGIKVNVEEH